MAAFFVSVIGYRRAGAKIVVTPAMTSKTPASPAQENASFCHNSAATQTVM